MTGDGTHPKSDSRIGRIIEMLKANPERNREVDGEIHALVFPGWMHIGDGIVAHEQTGTRKESAEFTGSADASMVLVDDKDQVDIWRDVSSGLWHVRLSRPDSRDTGAGDCETLPVAVTLAALKRKFWQGGV